MNIMRTSAFVTLALMLVSAQRAAATSDLVISNAMFPVDVVLPSTAGSFAIQGTLHVVTRVLLSDTTVDVQANLLDTTGTNLNTGEVAPIVLARHGTLNRADNGTLQFTVLVGIQALLDELAEINALVIMNVDPTTGRLLNAMITPFACDLCG